MPRQSNSLAPVTILCFALLLPLAYPLSYLALSKPVIISGTCAYDTPWRCSDYRLGGDFARKVYHPLERLDRWARPTFWDPTDPRPMRWRAALIYAGAIEGGSSDINVKETLPEITLPDFSEAPTNADATDSSSDTEFGREL